MNTLEYWAALRHAERFEREAADVPRQPRGEVEERSFVADAALVWPTFFLMEALAAVRP